MPRSFSNSARSSEPVNLALSPRQLVEQLEQLGGGADAAICFDGDGTLWSGDVGEDMFEFALRERLLRPEALEYLQRFAQDNALPLFREANEQAADLLRAFRQGQLSERDACIVMAVAFAGWNRNDLLAVVSSALSEACVPQRLFEPLQAVFEWVQRTGTRALLISASPDFVVEVAAKHWGFAPEAIAACTPQVHEDLLHGSLDYALPYAADKVQAARIRLGERRWLASFGDSAFDLAMLKEAQIGVAIRPKPSLVKLLSENPSLWLFQE